MGIALGFDQLGNMVFNNFVGRWLFGPYIGRSEDETISSALGKEYERNGGKFIWKHPGAKIIGPMLNKIDKDHCEDAIEHDEGRPEPR